MLSSTYAKFQKYQAKIKKRANPMKGNPRRFLSFLFFSSPLYSSPFANYHQNRKELNSFLF